MSDAPTTATPDPDEVQYAIDFLSTLNAEAFAHAVADVVTARPGDDDDVLRGSAEPVSKAAAEIALRSIDLIEHSMAAVNFHIKRTNNLLNERSPDFDRRKANSRRRFLELMGRERAILGSTRKALATIHEGLVDNSPNPRKRAMERLWQLNLAGDVPQGTGRDLLAEEEAKVAAAREARRAEAKAAKKRSRTG